MTFPAPKWTPLGRLVESRPMQSPHDLGLAVSISRGLLTIFIQCGDEASIMAIQ
ncbi:hypothetical protein [Variovorax sp. E3]|uniref:hypothetical protein n=1 Tax=Variovorax sp. E3 TaxID=1914993 RepID=UPI0018DB4791|nr:hypothetical protein [Variovorax sp. E3]